MCHSQFPSSEAPWVRPIVTVTIEMYRAPKRAAQRRERHRGRGEVRPQREVPRLCCRPCSAAVGCWRYGGYEPTDFWGPHLVMVKPKGREIFGWPSLDWQKLIQHLLLVHQ